MTKSKPLYKSFRESFNKDFCSAVTNVVSAPVTVLELKEANDTLLLSSDSAPQNVILLIDANLNVFTKYGKSIISQDKHHIGREPVEYKDIEDVLAQDINVAYIFEDGEWKEYR